MNLRPSSHDFCQQDPRRGRRRFFELAERRDQPEIKVGNYIEQALANASA